MALGWIRLASLDNLPKRVRQVSLTEPPLTLLQYTLVVQPYWIGYSMGRELGGSLP